MTPWWVLVLVGVLGIVGAWGAQVIAAHNERRRRASDREHDAAAHWRDERLEVYSEFLRAVEVATDSARRLCGLVMGGGEGVPLSGALGRVGDAFAPVELIGTETAIRLAQALHVQFLLLDLSEFEKLGDKDQRQSDVRVIERLTEQMRQQLRTELALALPQTAENT